MHTLGRNVLATIWGWCFIDKIRCHPCGQLTTKKWGAKNLRDDVIEKRKVKLEVYLQVCVLDDTAPGLGRRSPHTVPCFVSLSGSG